MVSHGKKIIFMVIKPVPMLTNVTNSTIRKKQQIAFKRLMLGKSPSIKIAEYIGLSFFELKQWLAPKMLPEMNWNNYGQIWVIEHLVPLDYFNFLKEEDCGFAWSYKNLIPVLIEHIYHIRYNMTFSQKYLLQLPPCHITEKLLGIVNGEIIEQNKYIECQKS